MSVLVYKFMGEWGAKGAYCPSQIPLQISPYIKA